MVEFDKTVLRMGTVVQFRVMTHLAERDAVEAVARAEAAFADVESVCSRFEETSELRRLCQQVGSPIKVGDILFETLQFALAVAAETDGLFDPTVGRVLQSRGFHRHYLTGDMVKDDEAAPLDATYRDVQLNQDERTVLLRRPLTLDLGAVAKGFALDLAAQALKPLGRFVIDAGGDVYVGGHNIDDEPWHIGIRHPIEVDRILCTLRASDVAVCTSGGYERPSPNMPGTHHLIDPKTGASPQHTLSATVIAPYAMMADAFSTVAFLVGCHQGIVLLEQLGLEGLLVDDQLRVHMTPGMNQYL